MKNKSKNNPTLLNSEQNIVVETVVTEEANTLVVAPIEEVKVETTPPAEEVRVETVVESTSKTESPQPSVLIIHLGTEEQYTQDLYELKDEYELVHVSKVEPAHLENKRAVILLSGFYTLPQGWVEQLLMVLSNYESVGEVGVTPFSNSSTLHYDKRLLAHYPIITGTALAMRTEEFLLAIKTSDKKTLVEELQNEYLYKNLSNRTRNAIKKETVYTKVSDKSAAAKAIQPINEEKCTNCS